MFDSIEFLKSLQDDARLTSLSTVSQFLYSMKQCADSNGLCLVKSLDISEGDWEKSLAESEGLVAYSNDDTIVVKESVTKDFGSEYSGPGIMVFDNVLTTRNKDRDGDIIEPAGLEVNEMPLLWQHVRSMPVGAMIKVNSRDQDQIRLKSVIADTALGCDCASLIEVGALKISQGFKPLEAKPLGFKHVKGNKVPSGWHVTKGVTVEHSLVSVPANSDAIITAFSRKNLNHDMVKAWAKDFYDVRPTIVPGADLKEDEEMTVKSKQTAEEIVEKACDEKKDEKSEPKADAKPAESCDDSDKKKKKKKKAIEHGGEDQADDQATDQAELPKSDDQPVETKEFEPEFEKHLSEVVPYLKGSHEHKLWLMSKALRKSCEKWCSVMGTFENTVVYSKDYDSSECYRRDYTYDGNKVKLGDDEKEVEVNTEILDKMHQEQSALVEKEIVTETVEKELTEDSVRSYIIEQSVNETMPESVSKAFDLVKSLKGHGEDPEAEFLKSLLG